MTITDAIHQAVWKVPASAWTPAVEPDGDVRDGAWAAEVAGDCLTGRPRGLRLIVRKERRHPGAQSRFTDAGGMRLPCFATNTAGEALAALELRSRRGERVPGCGGGWVAHDLGRNRASWVVRGPDIGGIQAAYSGRMPAGLRCAENLADLCVIGKLGPTCA